MSNYRIEHENKKLQEDGLEWFIQEFQTKNFFPSPHIHSAVEILYIVQGDFKIISDDTEYLVHPGDMVLVRSYALHLIYSLQDTPSSYYVLKLTPSFLLDFSSRDRSSAYLLTLAIQNQTEKTVWSADECQKNRIASSMQRLMEEVAHSAYCSDIAIKICAAEVILAILRDIDLGRQRDPAEIHNEDLSRRMYEATIYINKNYAQEISAQDCSRYVHLSYSYFSRNFKRLTGKSFTDYLTSVRISRAERELASTKKSITEIAAECGFNTVSYFISKFREKKGITPSVYREISTGGSL